MRSQASSVRATAVRGAAFYRPRPRAGPRPWSGKGTRRASSSRGRQRTPQCSVRRSRRRRRSIIRRSGARRPAASVLACLLGPRRHYPRKRGNRFDLTAGGLENWSLPGENPTAGGCSVSEGFVSRGFRGRRRRAEGDDRLPPGQTWSRASPSSPRAPRPARRSPSGTSRSPARWTSRRRGRGKSFERSPQKRSRATSTASPSGRSYRPGGKASPWIRCSQGSRRRRSTSRRSAAGATPRTCRWKTSRGQDLGRLRLRRRAARTRARRPGAAPRPAPLLLEERQVGQGPQAVEPRRTRLLGVLGLPRLRRPLARATLLGRLR
jgi:hypothetical protein